MASSKTPTDDHSASQEAEDLAKEGAETLAHGDAEEGRFLIDAANDLDPEAAARALNKTQNNKTQNKE